MRSISIAIFSSLVWIFPMAIAPVSVRAAPGENAFSGPAKGQVVRVIDGDTLEVTIMIWLDMSLTTKVRLADIDTPEIWRPDCAKERFAGEQAKALVERFVGFGQVRLFDIHYGKYAGRVVARVENAKGQDLSQALLAAGFGDKDWCA
jgi:endonuclease YncB( thermonuclease family)